MGLSLCLCPLHATIAMGRTHCILHMHIIACLMPHLSTFPLVLCTCISFWTAAFLWILFYIVLHSFSVLRSSSTLHFFLFSCIYSGHAFIFCAYEHHITHLHLVPLLISFSRCLDIWDSVLFPFQDFTLSLPLVSLSFTRPGLVCIHFAGFAGHRTHFIMHAHICSRLHLGHFMVTHFLYGRSFLVWLLHTFAIFLVSLHRGFWFTIMHLLLRSFGCTYTHLSAGPLCGHATVHSFLYPGFSLLWFDQFLPPCSRTYHRLYAILWTHAGSSGRLPVLLFFSFCHSFCHLVARSRTTFTHRTPFHAAIS